MKRLHLVRLGLTYYWRTNVAVVGGVAAAVTVLAGALLVGDSVRGSLRDLVIERLGRTDLVVVSSEFFRAGLADDLRADPSFPVDFHDICPIIAVPGLATDQASGRRASRVQVYGVDDRFWRFHAVSSGFRETAASSREVLLSEALARDVGAAAGSTLLLRVQRPSEIPLESLHGRKDALGRTVRLAVRAVLSAADLGEFSLQPQQGEVRAAFVPLARLQQDLDLPGQVNTLLVSVRAAASRGPESPARQPNLQSQLENLIRRHASLEDVGLRLRALDAPHVISVESAGTLIDARREEATLQAGLDLGLRPTPVLTYLVNTLRAGDRSIPYSLVTAVDLALVAPDLRSEEAALPPIVLNEWAARDLGATVGDRITLDYFVWEDPGTLDTRSSPFRLARIVPLHGAAADRDFAPVYPGITESENLRDWDPPFPIDLSRIRSTDEDYWRRYRTTPKAFIPEASGRVIWRSRYGSLTSIRFAPPRDASLDAAREQLALRLRSALDPLAAGLSVGDVRQEGLSASRGATDFGEYFTYFSFFLVVSAIMLAALFFKLGVEQRSREVGLLRAVGFTTRAVRRLFAGEAIVVSLLGSLIGLLGALAYGGLMMTGLRTWWVDAVGTTALTLHVSAMSLIAGAAGGVAAALVCLWWTLGALARVSERSLLAGQLEGEALARQPANQPIARPFQGRVQRESERRALLGALGFLLLGLLLLAGGTTGWLGRAGAFFGAGASLLTCCLFAMSFWLQRSSPAPLGGHGWWSVSRLGFRNASYRPTRSVLSIAVMASATFIVISVDAFRPHEGVGASGPRSGTGGYALLVHTVLPIAHDPNSREGRDLLGLSGLSGVTTEPFRLLPGDDASCLNLYAPKQPRILAVRHDFVAQGRFAFQSSLGESDAELSNPWLLLERNQPNAAIPVIADAKSMTYVLHKGLGDEMVVNHRGQEVRLRLVAALADSIFQSELLMSEANFLKLFPERQGYQFLLVDAPADRQAEAAAAIEDRLSDFGADAMPTAERLAAFHTVENTYISTFQTLGGLGLLLGTVGLAAVLLRNALERRRELALLAAVGYSRNRLVLIVIAESALLLACGLATGVICALVAIAPATAERGGNLPTGAGAWLLLFLVFGTGLVSSIVATRAAIHARLLDALRAE